MRQDQARRRFDRVLVFRTTPRVPVPSRKVFVQATRGAVAEGLVHAALHPLDGLVLRQTLRAGAGGAPVHVRVFCANSALRSATGAALGAAAFSLAYAALADYLQASQRPGRALVAAAGASVLSIAVDAPLRISGAGARMGANTELRHALAAGARDVPADAIEFGAYELFRGAATTPHVRALAGAASGMLSTLAVAPLDAAVAQMLACKKGGSMLGSLRHVWRARAAFAGAGGRCLREAVASALFFCVYDDGGEAHEEEAGT